MVIVAVVNLLNSGEPSQQMRIWCTLDKSIGGDDDKEGEFFLLSYGEARLGEGREGHPHGLTVSIL